MNDLDRALKAVRRSRSSLPEFYRQLTLGDLWFLVPFHPEVEGLSLELKTGAPLPFVTLEDEKGAVIPLFSSEERVAEGTTQAGVSPRTFSTGSLPALRILEILGNADLRAVINKSCSTGDVTIPANLMRDLVSGKVFKPAGLGPPESGKLTPINPADYPTHLVQPAFEFMRRAPNFRAAWIFALPDRETPAGNPLWQMLILMQPPESRITRELELVVQGARRTDETIALGLVDENDADLVKRLFASATPFYRAADPAENAPKSTGS